MNFFIMPNISSRLSKHPTLIVMLPFKSLSPLFCFFLQRLKRRHDLKLEANKEKEMTWPTNANQDQEMTLTFSPPKENVFSVHQRPKTEKKNLTSPLPTPPPHPKKQIWLLGCVLAHLARNFYFQLSPQPIFGLG